ncbi:protein CHROMATIN REMODELING 5-like isoform X4 [Vigna radiata var. radiata]|uniref:Protein CHROMATIN REMODELING 5-like isoform X4 n=1 Tax=Vigna radiata var. radiata TaxID=3916 RepID=A0A3Q0EJ82_VIGRR|nr:protein CHROMATIN REMODELING 5-like isoform X4 [Vigna radiata var. radiata]
MGPASLRKLEEQPEWLKGGKLRDYQLEGLNFLVNSWRNDTNVILGDEMGLGKIVQSVSMLGFHQNAQQIHGPFLGVVPLSTLSNWAKEFRKWLPEMNIIIYVGTRASREEFISKNKLFITGTPSGESGLVATIFIIGTPLHDRGCEWSCCHDHLRFIHCRFDSFY